MVKLIYDNTKNSDMFYAVKHYISDPFFYLEIGRKKLIFLDEREIGYFKEKNKDKNLKAFLLKPFLKELKNNQDQVGIREKMALNLITKYKLRAKKILVPDSFPVAIVDYLRQKKIRLDIQKNIFPERLIKNKNEISEIESALRRTKKLFLRLENILKRSIVKNKSIFYLGKILTSEILKRELAHLMIDLGLRATEGMIISSGEQSTMPHHAGSGPLKANQAIIADIFPRDLASGYFADMTRTYVKGKPSPELKAMWQTVLAGQKLALSQIRPGVKVKDIHNRVRLFFEDKGYLTQDEGFIHALGHGIGLNVHEAPSLSPNSLDRLQPGQVFTIEPGLYYKNIGGVRIEDVVVVTKTGYKNLTNFPNRFIFK